MNDSSVVIFEFLYLMYLTYKYTKFMQKNVANVKLVQVCVKNVNAAPIKSGVVGIYLALIHDCKGSY